MAVELDIPCDVQGRDSEGRLWAFMDEAAHPEAIIPGRHVVTGDEADPVVARVLDIVEGPGGSRVTMELIGDAVELWQALARARVVAV